MAWKMVIHPKSSPFQCIHRSSGILNMSSFRMVKSFLSLSFHQDPEFHYCFSFVIIIADIFFFHLKLSDYHKVLKFLPCIMPINHLA